MIENAYLKISAIYPRSVLESTRKLMLQSGVQGITARAYLGFATIVSLSLGLAALLFAPVFTRDPLIIFAAPIAAAGAAGMLFYLSLSMGADSRAKSIEALLPDGLQLISANMRAGMTLENAIWSAAVPEFGALRDEIRKVSADAFAGKPIETALSAMRTRVRSHIVERTLKLVSEGIQLGGEIAPLLDEVSADIKSIQNLQKEIATSTTMYAIFIVFAAVLAAPVLFSVSTFYTQMNEQITAKQHATSPQGEMPQVQGLPALFASAKKQQAGAITAADIQGFSTAAIIITTFFAGIILGQIRTGNWTEGLKYSPIFIAVALGLYYLGAGVLASTLGKII